MRIKTLCFVLVAVLSGFAGGAANAEDGVALKQLEPGTVLNYAAKRGPLKVTVRSMNGPFIIQDEVGESSDTIESVAFSVAMSPKRAEKMSEANRALVLPLFPLKVGNAVKLSHDGETRGNRWSCMDKIEVSGVEKVTVPAGTFDTYLITTAQRDVSTSWRGDGTCWYSPEVGHCVKVKWRSSKNDDDWELVSVVAPAAAR